MAGPEDSSINIAGPERKPMRRRRKQRRRKKDRLAWLKASWQELIIAGLAVAAIFMMFFPRIYPSSAEWGIEWFGLIVLAIAVVYGGVRIQHHILFNRNWWRRQGCPDCGQYELKRQRRTQLDHAINRLGIPRRRYICPDCDWRGPLIDDAQI